MRVVDFVESIILNIMNIDPKPLVSVIVPVYNMEKLLPKCMGSILRQTYTTIEVIIVDDGSTDRSGEIADEYAKNDTRVTVVHQKNGGIACAINSGLDRIQGEYFMFVDSDDYISPIMVERLLSLQLEYKADVVQCERFSFPVPEGIGFIEQKLGDVFVYQSRKEVLDDFFHHKKISRNLAARLFKSSLFEGIKCDPGRMIIDAVTLPRVLVRCERYVFTDEKYYYVYEAPTSASRSKYTMRKWDDCKFANSFIEKFVKEQCPEYIDYAYYRYVYTTQYAYVAMITNKQEEGRKEILYESMTMFRRYYPMLCKSAYYNTISLAQRKSFKRFNSTPILYSHYNRIIGGVISKLRLFKYKVKQ